MSRILIIAEPGSKRSEVTRAFAAAGFACQATDLGFAGIDAVGRFLPDAVAISPPPGLLGRAYLAQFRFADYSGPLLVLAAEPEDWWPRGLAGPVVFVGEESPAETVEACKRALTRLRDSRAA